MTDLDVTGIIATGALCVAISGLGAGIDKLLREHQRTIISEVVFKWWVMIDKLKIPDIPTAIAKMFLRAEKAIFGSRILSLRWLLSTVVVSFLFTFTALFMGDFLFYGEFQSAFDNIVKRNPIIVFPVNYFFDVLTLLITVGFMKLVLMLPRPLALGPICFDIVIAVCIGFLCYSIVDSFEFPETADFTCCPLILNPEALSINIRYFLNYFVVFIPGLAFLFDSFPVHMGDLGNFAFASTSMLPTVYYLLTLLLLSFSVLTIRGTQWLALHLFSLDIETNRSIFLYAGVLLGVIAIVVKLIIEGIKTLGL